MNNDNITNHNIKRFNNEVIELFSKYKNITIKYKENLIILTINNKEIHINNKYPFHPPCVYINSKPYAQFLNIKSHKITQILKKYIKTDCLCCSTLLCASNWTATYHIQKIMDEINYINELKKIVRYNLAVIELCDKKMIPTEIGETIIRYLNH